MTQGVGAPSFDSVAAAYEKRVGERPDEHFGFAGLSCAYRGLGRRQDAIRAARRAIQLVDG